VIAEADQPTVDVVIPCFNHGRFLTEAVESALGQTYPHVNVTVIDDGSTDETPAVAARFGNRIRYLRIAHGGLMLARNTGINATNGDFLIFLDADDYLDHDSVRRHIEAARQQPSASVIYGDYRLVDEGRLETWDDGGVDLGEDAFHSLLASRVPPCHAMTFRRSAIVNAGGFETSIGWHEDLDLWLRIAAAGHRFVRVDFVGAFYRKYGGTRTRQYLEMAYWGIVVLRRTQQYHRDCPVCRELLPKQLSKWKICYANAIRLEVMTPRPHGERGRHVVKGLRHLLYNPSVARYLLRGLGRWLRDKTVPFAAGTPRV
jgi:glycosyltransferase involved in cell wall biosynthesis